MNNTIRFDAALIRRYDVAGPRYTSYPTAAHFHGDLNAQVYRQALQQRDVSRPLSLYFHLPFCSTVCFYCACHKIITKRHEHAQPYVARLQREIELLSDLLGDSRRVMQLHWGGGTPTFLSIPMMQQLMATTRAHFDLCRDHDAEYGIEIDPRQLSDDALPVLRELGFNRLSIGVQDFDTRVQKAVNRVQSYAQTMAVLHEARRLGFHSINVDLIYGLPLQTVDSFTATLDKILALQPDRLSLFNYAHLPEQFKPQRRIQAEDLPAPAEKLAILQHSIDTLTAAGYCYIGMDHFARADDELTLAQRNKQLTRNFQGYSTHGECDLLGFGVTAIGSLNQLYAQNHKTLEAYFACIDAGEPAILRGVMLSRDDVIRREIILQLCCHFTLDIAEFENRHQIDFTHEYANELTALHVMQDDGLLRLSPQRLIVLPIGRLLVRNICMVFDRYMQRRTATRYSKVI